jgi:hypothetical protein
LCGGSIHGIFFAAGEEKEYGNQEKIKAFHLDWFYTNLEKIPTKAGTDVIPFILNLYSSLLSDHF